MLHIEIGGLVTGTRGPVHHHSLNLSVVLTGRNSEALKWLGNPLSVITIWVQIVGALDKKTQNSLVCQGEKS